MIYSHEPDERLREVQEQQRPIAEWMNATIDAKGLSATGWAKKAGLGRDTVSRAIKEQYQHVTSTSTLLKLAKAAGVPAPVHLGKSPSYIPPSDVLGNIFYEILSQLIPNRDWEPELTAALGQAFRHTLLELADDSEDQDNAARARMAARIAARQLRAGIGQTTPETD